ncbi:Trehalose-phosphatase [Macleaya cordata]|uniref:Trehalose 6-phosphate phosphatase n=1 Tax=Macleaya cordata TaxID=56857 RepID=A0A200PUR6_MACCD|nr:Trehalose-phosphatase [Macleaya cordata]
MKHPSALSKFEGMMKEAKGKRIVVFLDYDGTLSPIVDDPNKAFMSDAMRAAVREVAMYFPTAIISGRCRDKVYEFVQLKDVYYAGSHGMDIVTPVGPHLKMMTQLDVKYQTSNAIQHKMNDIILFQPAQEYLPAIQEIVKVLEEKTKRIHGAMVENNRFCISVHFRRVREEDYCKLEEQVKSVVKDKPQFRITRGRKVIEIRPSIKWDKGHALEYLLHNLGPAFLHW